MRLLHTRSLKLVDFFSHGLPPYAILSHTWGPPNDEVLFEDIQAGREKAEEKASFSKLHYTVNQAIADGLEYCWIDTCCIDKKSSAELQEAINSMFMWYAKATVCYVYLSDVCHARSVEEGASQFRMSRWHSRGWTLQELIAPQKIDFYDYDWEFIGTKSTLCAILSDITRISRDILNGNAPIETACVAQRMSWASQRETSRPEDLAYCLMGIFSVNMTMLYGEGNKAFVRLQEEICKESDDHSIFAWQNMDAENSGNIGHGVLAEHPRHFRDSWAISVEDKRHKSNGPPIFYIARSPIAMMNQGLQMNSYLLTLKSLGADICILILRCWIKLPAHADKGYIGILVRPKYLHSPGTMHVRLRSDVLVLCKDRPHLTKEITLSKAGSYILDDDSSWTDPEYLQVCHYKLGRVRCDQASQRPDLRLTPVYISQGSLTSWAVIAWTALHRLSERMEARERKLLGSITFHGDNGNEFTIKLALYRGVRHNQFFPDKTTVYRGEIHWKNRFESESWVPAVRSINCGDEQRVHVYVDEISNIKEPDLYTGLLDFTFLIRIKPRMIQTT
jgi:hypothetical protein